MLSRFYHVIPILHRLYADYTRNPDFPGAGAWKRPPFSRKALIRNRKAVSGYGLEKFSLLLDSTLWANACAGSAADACIGIDLVDVSLRDCSDRALALAGSASDAAVSDLVSHIKLLSALCSVFL